MDVWKKETFGPVAPILVVDDESAAIDAANDSDYDLGASVWTKSLDNAFELSRRIRAGLIWINDVNVAFPAGPWGGIQKSGGSKELSRRALLEYSGYSLISLDYSKTKTRDWWFPYRGS